MSLMSSEAGSFVHLNCNVAVIGGTRYRRCRNFEAIIRGRTVLREAEAYSIRPPRWNDTKLAFFLAEFYDSICKTSCRVPWVWRGYFVMGNSRSLVKDVMLAQGCKPQDRELGEGLHHDLYLSGKAREGHGEYSNLSRVRRC